MAIGSELKKQLKLASKIKKTVSYSLVKQLDCYDNCRVPKLVS